LQLVGLAGEQTVEMVLAQHLLGARRQFAPGEGAVSPGRGEGGRFDTMDANPAAAGDGDQKGGQQQSGVAHRAAE
jgi:hypothetical protein